MWAKMSVFKLVIFAVALCYADGKKIESMVVSKMRMSDLETSGTGYAYAQQQGYPASYITYTNHGGQKLYQPPKTAVYGVPPVALPGIPQRQFGDGLYPNLNPLIYAPQALPVAERSVPFVVKHPISHQNYKVDSTDESDLEEFRAADNNKWRPSVGHAGHDDAYVNDAGQTYDAAKYSAHGAKGEKGFEKHNEFDDGEKGAHFEDHHKGHYNNEGGHKKAHGETATHYAEHGAEEKGTKGENYGQVKYHKKGHKTSGFHNVYHKDEYKKDTDFYDEKHDGGNYEKYGSNDEHHRNAEGAYEKGLRHDSAYNHGHHANQGGSDKGQHHKHHQGHSHQKGDDSYYRKEADFDKNSGNEYKKNYGNKYGYLN